MRRRAVQRLRRAEVLHVRPGDVIAYGHPDRLHPEERTAIATELRRVFPNNVVGILEGGAALKIVRPEATR